MKRLGKFVRLELPDLIRMNRLVRGQIDFAGFDEWYEALDPDERLELVDMLAAYACEAGVTREIYDQALEQAGLEAQDAWVAQVGGLFWSGGEDPRHGGLQAVRGAIEQVDARELRRYLRWAVFLFGVAEGRAYALATPEHCTHWWHRDLADDRVVQDLLRNPSYVMTAMRDDSRVKAASWWRRLLGR